MSNEAAAFFAKKKKKKKGFKFNANNIDVSQRKKIIWLPSLQYSVAH